MELVIYTQIICPKCKALKLRLREQGLTFKEINVDQDKNAMLDLLMNQMSGTPVVKINDVWLYDPTIEEILTFTLDESR